LITIFKDNTYTMEAIRNVFKTKAAEVSTNPIRFHMLPTTSQGAPAFLTFITAGYPREEDTVPLILAMEAGGADIIELGMPFSDPIADGQVIQETNTVSSKNIYCISRIYPEIPIDCTEE
jgi:tryptophan synthase